MLDNPSSLECFLQLNGIFKEYAEKFAIYTANSKQIGSHRMEALRKAEPLFYETTEKIRKKAIFYLIELQINHEKEEAKKRHESETWKSDKDLRGTASEANIYASNG